MKRTDFRTGASLALLFSLASLAAAQDTQASASGSTKAAGGDARIEVGLAFAQVLGTSTFSATLKQREYAEDGSFTGSYKVKAAPGAGVDVQYNLTPRFGVRAGFQTFSRKSDATFEAQIPHPFYFNQQRKVSGAQSGLGFSESAITLTGVYRGGSGKWKVNVEAGAAFFTVNATVADRVNFGDVYPYDTATFSGVASSKRKVSPIGVAAGIEVGRQLSDAVTVIAGGRFTGGSGDLDIAGAKVSVKAGGAQARVGLRFTLTRRK